MKSNKTQKPRSLPCGDNRDDNKFLSNRPCPVCGDPKPVRYSSDKSCVKCKKASNTRSKYGGKQSELQERRRAIEEHQDRMRSSDGLIYDVADEAVRLKAAEKKAFWWSAEFTHAVHRGKILEAWRDYLLLKLKGVV